jgi:hypothetical protein
LVGLAAWFLFRSPTWQDSGGPAWFPTAAAYVALSAFLLVAGAISSLVRPARWPLFAAASVAAVCIALGAAIGDEDGTGAASAAMMAVSSSLPLLGLAELERRSRAYSLTNLRIAYAGGLFRRRTWSLQYADLTDLDGHQSPWGRAMGHGTLLPITAASQGVAQRLIGVRPYQKVRILLELLIRDATATEFLRDETGLKQKVGAALQALHR